MSRGWIVALIVAVVGIGAVAVGAFAFFAFVVLPVVRNSAVGGAGHRAMIDHPAPQIAMTTLDGRPWSLADQQGKTVVLHFWASWCGPCRRQMSYLRTVQQDFGDRDDFAMVGVSLDETADAAREAIETEGLSWTQLYSAGSAWDLEAVRDYKVRSIPSIWLVGPDGEVRAVDLYGRGIEAAVRRTLDGA